MRIIVSLISMILYCLPALAVTTGDAMNVSGAGSDYIFVYRGNDPTLFSVLEANKTTLVGWTFACNPSQACSAGYSGAIWQVTQPDTDSLYLYTKDNSGNIFNPDSGSYYSFASPPPPLCCGGSAAPFSASSTHVPKVQSFVTRSPQDTKVQIEQIGNSNTITVDQTGTPNNYVKYDGNGTNNNITITQRGNASTAVNYIDLKVTGNTNSITTTQQSTGGGKGIFATVNDDNNVVTVQQKDNGSHYLSLNLSGGNKTVDVLQQGSASHMANITLTGQPSSVQLSQSGSTQQFYSITSNCGTAGGCAPIQVQQGK